jgi:hypothetical protein
MIFVDDCFYADQAFIGAAHDGNIAAASADHDYAVVDQQSYDAKIGYMPR